MIITIVENELINFLSLFLRGDYGIIETSGDRWKMHRRFILHFLRDSGMGKGLMEEKVNFQDLVRILHTNSYHLDSGRGAQYDKQFEERLQEWANRYAGSSGPRSRLDHQFPAFWLQIR